jgi:hypothetical protein
MEDMADMVNMVSQPLSRIDPMMMTGQALPQLLTALSPTNPDCADGLIQDALPLRTDKYSSGNTSRAQPQEWSRSEPRISIDLGSIPFIASRENGRSSFSYLLRDVSPSGVGITVPPQGGVAPLEVGETISFHLPFQLNQKFYNQGVIRWQQTESQEQVCGACLEKRIPLRYPIYVAFQAGDIRFVLEEFGIPSVEKLVGQILDDAFYFKKGLSIYFEHLAPYFARHSHQSVNNDRKPYEDVVPRIREGIQENIRKIQSLKKKAAQEWSAQSFPTATDLESFRAAIAFELELEVLCEGFDRTVVLPYLRSVKLLEHQLYSNFNTLVLVFLQTSGRRVVGRRPLSESEAVRDGLRTEA